MHWFSYVVNLPSSAHIAQSHMPATGLGHHGPPRDSLLHNAVDNPSSNGVSSRIPLGLHQIRSHPILCSLSPQHQPEIVAAISRLDQSFPPSQYPMTFWKPTQVSHHITPYSSPATHPRYPSSPLFLLSTESCPTLKPLLQTAVPQNSLGHHSHPPSAHAHLLPPVLHTSY